MKVHIGLREERLEGHRLACRIALLFLQSRPGEAVSGASPPPRNRLLGGGPGAGR